VESRRSRTRATARMQTPEPSAHRGKQTSSVIWHQCRSAGSRAVVPTAYAIIPLRTHVQITVHRDAPNTLTALEFGRFQPIYLVGMRVGMPVRIHGLGR
jgi:hypothetical protein